MRSPRTPPKARQSASPPGADNATAYALTADAGGRFTVSSTGLITVADGSLLNYEDAAAHSITVEAARSTRG